jgi:hypothetical protein
VPEIFLALPASEKAGRRDESLGRFPFSRLSADPAKEPSDESTEYQPDFGRERNVGGHAYKDAEHYPDQRGDANKEPRSPSVFPDSHTDHPRLPRNSRSRTHKGPWCGLGCRGPGGEPNAERYRGSRPEDQLRRGVPHDEWPKRALRAEGLEKAPSPKAPAVSPEKAPRLEDRIPN